MGTPTGNNYPKMVTIAAGPGGGLVPAVYPAGDAKQFQIVYLADAPGEKAYTGNGVAPFSTSPSGSGGSWENRHGGK